MRVIRGLAVQHLVKVVLSLSTVAVSLYVILARPEDEAARQWAVGVIAFVLGYYLRGSESQVPRG